MWQDKQDRKAKEILNDAQANVAKSIKENLPDGSGDGKGSKPKGGTVALGISGVVMYVIQMQVKILMRLT